MNQKSVIFTTLLGRIMSKKKLSSMQLFIVLILVSGLSVLVTLLIVVRFLIISGSTQELSNKPELPLKKETSSICNRETPYKLESEFERALSLIVQRFNQNPDTQPLANIVQVTRNCLNIQYAPDRAMSGAEGLFFFDRNSTSDNLQILVSDKYVVKDDILTAVLLVHEVTHSYLYATGKDRTITCYENEGKAFSNEFIFITNALNQEEKNSLIGRYRSLKSPEVIATIDLILVINRYPGNTIFDQATNMVRSNPYYQQQCGES